MTYKDRLAGATVAQLRINAAAAGIVGRSKMNKAELVEAVAAAWTDVVEFAYADALASVPADLCSHGIALGRCSICAEDAALGPVEETDGRCPYGNIHAIETCLGCGTEDEQGNQVTSVRVLGKNHTDGRPTLTPMREVTRPEIGTAEKPVTLSVWLEEGMVLVDPRSVSGARYRFVKWTRHGAKLVSRANGGVRIVSQSAIMDWLYLPKASAAAIEQAKADNRPHVGDVVKFHAGDARERTVTTVHATDPSLVMLNDGDNVWVSTEHLRVVRSRASLMCAKSFHDSNGDRGICAVRQGPGARGNHEGPHYDDQRRLWSDYTLPGDRRPRCGVPMTPWPGEWWKYQSARACSLLLNADGECPDANHRPAGVAINFQSEQFVAQQMQGRPLRDAPVGGELRCALQADVQASGSINAKLIRDREDAQARLHELRCAIAELVGRWQADSSAQARLFGNVLESVLQEHR